MPVDLSHFAPVNPDDGEYQALMRNLQCNILKSHGRNATAHIFLKFSGQGAQEKAKEWIRTFAESKLTTAWQQYEQSREFKAARARGENPKGPLVGAFFLTAAGYRFLGLDPKPLSTHDGETFGKGMKHRKHAIIPNLDPPFDQWEPGYREEIHAMVLLAHEDRDVVAAAADEEIEKIEQFATVVAKEFGVVLRNTQKSPEGKIEREKEGQPIEHFGYVDGRSNPVFFEKEIEEEIGGTDKWHPAAPLSLVLHKDPFSQEAHSYGSFFVFRKLEQDVPGFAAAVEKLAQDLGTTPELAGAMVVGRFKDGTPVTLQQTDGLKDVNNFSYRHDDKEGTRCPAHAHIRKVNPRGTTPHTTPEEERTRRLTRRGIPYGSQEGNEPKGLLFMCYQSNIEHQFEFVQRTWADNPSFPKNLFLPHTGDDPLIGQDDRSLSRAERARMPLLRAGRPDDAAAAYQQVGPVDTWRCPTLPRCSGMCGAPS